MVFQGLRSGLAHPVYRTHAGLLLNRIPCSVGALGLVFATRGQSARYLVLTASSGLLRLRALT